MFQGAGIVFSHPWLLIFRICAPTLWRCRSRHVICWSRGSWQTCCCASICQPHSVRSDKALYDYVQELKTRYLRNAAYGQQGLFDNKIHVVRNALGLHTAVSRVQGSRLAAKREIRIASMFKQAPDEFLRMIVVHELAHLREKNHDKAFYQLCGHMEPQYHQYEFDLRLYLTHVERAGARLWGDELV